MTVGSGGVTGILPTYLTCTSFVWYYVVYHAVMACMNCSTCIRIHTYVHAVPIYQ